MIYLFNADQVNVIKKKVKKNRNVLINNIMYGLSSQESLSKRQTIWAKEINNELRYKTPIVHSLEKNNIITFKCDNIESQEIEPADDTSETSSLNKLSCIDQKGDLYKEVKQNKIEIIERINRLENLIKSSTLCNDFKTYNNIDIIEKIKLLEAKINEVKAMFDQIFNKLLFDTLPNCNT